MADEMEDQSGHQWDLGRFLDIVRRRHLVFLTLLPLGWGIVWGASWLLPLRYKSVTMILVEPPSMPRNYVLPNVSDDLQNQIQSITQQIMSRTRLLRIIDKFSLYEDKHHLLTPDQKVTAMRKDIDIELVRDPHDNDINAFRVSYTGSEPYVAQRVTSELTSLFIDENLSVRQQQSEDTTKFLQNQLDAARLSLAEQDAKVRAFQTAHQGALPTQQAGNLQILAGLQSQLQNEQDALNAARQQRVYHESMADQYRALQATPRTADGAPAGLAALEQQLHTLRSKLTDLSGRYTDRFPQVQELKSEIARIEKERQQLASDLAQGTHARNQAAGAQAQEDVDPALNAPLLQFQSQLKADDVEISNREQAIANLKSEINQYQARVGEEPAVAQQMADLTRGYTQSQTNYDELLKKVSDSQMATSMEQMQQGERFTMIDPPSLPLKPDSPNRMKICWMGIGIGMALGIMAVLLLELFDDRLHNDGDIEKLLSTEVISEIPEIVTPAEGRRDRRRAFLGWAMAGMVVAVIFAGAAFTYLKT